MLADSNQSRPDVTHEGTGHFPHGSQSREASVTRGQNLYGPGTSQPPAASSAAASSSRAPSAHPTIPEGETTLSNVTVDSSLQRRLSNRHHRQTSVINGLQHSRNPSFNSPLTASPLSPESLHNASLRNVAGPRRGPGYAADMDSPNSSFAPSAHLHGPSIDSTLNLDPSQSMSSGSIHTQSSNSRGGRNHAYGASINTQPDGRTPSEYAMHHLLNAFFIRADQKINSCLSKLDGFPLPVEHVCGPGADPAFDQLLRALGHVSCQQPKALVDSLMFWRQNKADIASASRKQLSSHRSPSAATNFATALPRRHTEPHSEQGLAHTGVPVANFPLSDEFASEEYVLLDRQATTSIFILCRGLIEVFEQSNLEAITPELATKLEDIVFEQLKGFEPHQLISNKIRAANWRIYGQLLGGMSRVDFARVTARYIQQVRSWQQEIATNTGSTTRVRELESRIELLLLSMQHLRLSAEPSTFPQTCEFLNALATLYADSHGPRIKQAYCAAFEALLLQIASRPDITEHEPRFKDFVDLVNPRINQMLTKMRHWSSALPTSISLLCLSSLDIFHSQWLSQINALSNKLRDRATRVPAMRAICQLVWAYLYRSSDSPAVRGKKIEDILKLIMPPGRKPHVSTEPAMAEALLCFARLISRYFRDLYVKMAILPLVNPDSIFSARDVRIEQIEPERVTIGIKSFLLVIEDQENKLTDWPSFPEFHQPLPAPDAMPSSPMPLATARLPEQPVVRRATHFSTSTSPVDLSKLDGSFKAFLWQFSEILGRITVSCDAAFGSSATLNEKLSTTTPKTPLVEAFTLNKRDDNFGFDSKAAYYDLLEVAIKAIPRCLSENMQLNTLVSLLCTASAHVQPHIALAATRSLKAIALQGHAQLVATAFPRFIFNYDHQYSTMSDDGRLGPAHIEATLTLYLELLQIWVGQIKKKFDVGPNAAPSNEPSAARALQMEMLLPLVEEIEGYGLFFLCSQSRNVRAYAVKVLQNVLEFDTTLGRKEQTRIISVLDSHSDQILDLPDDTLTVLERSRLQKDRRQRGIRNVLIELGTSENYYDSTLWFKAFPNMIRSIFELCPHAAALSREFVCDRLALMLPEVERISNTAIGSKDVKLLGRSSDTPVGVFLDQWKLYLVMACVTLNSTGGQSRGQLDSALHTRKASRNAAGLQDKLSSARSLFSAVIPLLGASSDTLRSAVVTALGSINRKLYRILLESLQYAVITCNDEAKLRRGAHQRTPSSPSRSQMTERMRTEVTCIYKLTASFLKHDDILRDEWILGNLMNYAKDLRLFLSDSDVQLDWKFSRLRYHYCGLVDVVYDNIKRYPESSLYMSFESRKSAFTLMEEWCGYHSDNQPSYIPSDGDTGDKSAIAKERISLRTAALSTMATLCAGPVSVMTETNTQLQFNVPRMLSWVDSVFASGEHKLREIGQRALKNLVIHNPGTTMFVEHAIQCCYGVKGVVAQEACFNVLADVLTQQPQFPISNIKVLGAVIFTLGHESRDVRIRSAKLLRFLDNKEQKSSNLQHFDISISDKTRAVYKAAQFEFSRRLAQTYPDVAFHVFSEFCLQFRNVSHDIQRSMVAAILPWLQTLDLQVLPDTNQPIDLSYMLLVNMIEITIRSESSLHNEVQALWQALATGPYGGNVQLILDFIIDLSLERREQNFVFFAKQIVVYLSTTPAGSKIFQHFLLQLAPKNMPNEKKSLSICVPDASHMPYMADLETLLPIGNRQGGLSSGQISLIFLVDLLVPPVEISASEALKLLHAVFILWDHHTSAVQEHAREMLVHLIHTLVVVRIAQEQSSSELVDKAEELVEAIRSNNSKLGWSYGEFAGRNEVEGEGNRVPPGMSSLAENVVELFAATIDDFNDAWAREALHWASVCPVRHLACRSFQVFRCISVKLDSTLLSDMLARLSNTIADEQADYQTFSLEILTTLRVVMAGLDTKQLMKFPQLLWTTVACLNTIHEREFFESLGMLQQLASSFNFADAVAVDHMMKAQPEGWEGEFTGIEPLLYKGLRSSQCLDRTLSVLEKLMVFPDSFLLGLDNRLLFNVLAHLPQVLENLKQSQLPDGHLQQVNNLAVCARTASYLALEQALLDLSHASSESLDNCTTHVLLALKSAFFPAAEADALIFLLGLLSNATNWFRINVLDILHKLIPMLDIRNSRITSHGADLISPLLRLLQTELCDQALGVMDQIMEINITPLERQHLRMSMASGPAQAIRKEYESTQSLYGIPETSGWSVPAPALLSAQTRKNVHHVFFACSDADDTGDTPTETPGIEFHAEEEFADSYFPPRARNDSHISFDNTTEITMGDIVNSLDSLDDFFEENDSPTTPMGETVTSGGFGSFTFFSGSDHETNVYDQQTAPIISKTYNRSSSSMSFHNGLADNRPPTNQYHRSQYSFSSGANFYQTSFTSIDEDDGPGPSLPTADKTPPVASHTFHTNISRPGLHARSITSPANQYPAIKPGIVTGLTQIPAATSDSQTFEEMFSDSESSPFPNMVPGVSHGTTKSVSSTPTSATDASGGFMRRGMRRLTGGKSESAKEKARLRAPSAGQNIYSASLGSSQSPRMPRIPSEYLNQGSSNGNPAGPSSSPLSPWQQN